MTEMPQTARITASESLAL